MLSVTEYAMPECHIILENVVADLSSLRGLVCFSVLQLPEQRAKRHALLEKVIAQRKEVHFAVESLVISNWIDVDRIDTILELRKALSYSLGADQLRVAVEEMKSEWKSDAFASGQ
tara:strand:- start:558 stop:905 length:348 start_codon:yes stop_codon:yes gene_type:complete